MGNSITDDVLNCKHHGTYIVTSSALNRPTTDGAYYYLCVFKAHTEDEMPCIAFSSTVDNIYYGKITTTSVIWKHINDGLASFYKNYLSINSLIDAVNPFRTINMLGPADSWDNLQNGVYCFANAHLGADVAFGFMIQYGYQSDRVTQFVIGASGIAKRYNIGNGWEEWSYSRF